MSTEKHRKSKRFLILITAFLVLALFIAGKLFLDAIYVPVIIMYHSVGDEKPLDGYGDKLNVLPKTFERQMDFLHDRGYEVIPLTEFIKKVKRKEKIPPRTIAITFDDGLKNNFTNAYPALKKYNFPATIFVPVDFVGKNKYLSWDEIKIMQDNNISIGSHTILHKWLPSLSDKDLKRELIDSKRILEEKTGREIETLSYPLGAHDERVKRFAKEAGYLGAVATNTGKNKPYDDIFALKRIRISMTSNNMLVFWIETSGYYTFIKEVRDEE